MDTKRMRGVATELIRQAAQENCDGEPYDTMQQAGECITQLLDEAEEFEKDRDGYYVHWDIIIKKVGNALGSSDYAMSPIELITDLIDQRDCLLTQMDEKDQESGKLQARVDELEAVGRGEICKSCGSNPCNCCSETP